MTIDNTKLLTTLFETILDKLEKKIGEKAMAAHGAEIGVMMLEGPSMEALRDVSDVITESLELIKEAIEESHKKEEHKRRLERMSEKEEVTA